MATTDLSILSVFLSFSEFHIVGITKYEPFKHSFTELHEFISSIHFHVKLKVAQLYLTLCDPMDYTVHGNLQARILEWVAFPFSRGPSQPRDWIQVSCIAGGFFSSWATSSHFHNLIAYFFLRMNSIPLSRCTKVYIFSHLLKDILVVFKFWQLWVKFL